MIALIDTLTCDKPYNVDEARKKAGLPRRKRKDSRTTAYELTIRVPPEYQEYFGNKKKLTKIVYAINKKSDLRDQVKAFEEEKNLELEQKLYDPTAIKNITASLNADLSFGDYIDRYRELRSHGAISSTTMRNEENFARYVKTSIGHILLKNLTSNDIECCILEVPMLSEKWAKELRDKREENRKTADWVKKHGRRVKPLAPPKIAGADKQYKVLKFCREVLNDAVDREVLERNVAKARFLTKIFKKSRPLIDPLMEDEAARLYHEIKLLSTGYLKLGLLLLLTTGIRPEELLAVTQRWFHFGDERSYLRVLGSVDKDSNEITPYTKTDNGYRNIDLDDYTVRTAKTWIEMKTKMFKELGMVASSSMPLMSDHDQQVTYNTFNKKWKEFTNKVGFDDTRLYALRHTFATLNLAHGENIRTISELMGHAKPSYTLDLYIAFVPSTADGLGNRFTGSLEKTYEIAE